MIKHLFFLAFFALASLHAVADTVEVDALKKRYDLGLFADYLEDVDGKLTVNAILNNQHTGEWQQSDSLTPNFAFSKSVYWLRINFHSQLQEEKSFLFELAFPLQDYIDYFLVENGNIIAQHSTGDRRAFDTRPIDYRNYLFDLDLPAGAERQVYLRLDTADGLHEPTPLILWDTQEFALQHGERSLGLGLYFGIMVVMGLYNLFVYVSIRDKNYLYYVSYILVFSFWLFTYYGFSYQYLWPNSPGLANQAIVVSTSIWNICMAIFVASFLNAREQIPWFNRVINLYIGSLLLTISISFNYHYSLGIMMVIALGIPTALSGIVAGIQSWRAGYEPARFFLLAWSVLLISLVIFCFKIAGLLPTIWAIERSVQIGSAIEVVLLSLGLADRINTLRKEKIAAQNAAIESFESSMKLKNDFITSISHELRTPMNAIMGGVDVCKTHSKELGEPLRIIRSGANDMMRLVDDILIHTELQSGQLKVKKQSTAVKPSIQRLKDFYGNLCQDKGLVFSCELDPEVPEWIMVDPHKLTVILTKLLNNAVKFTEKGEVKLSVVVDDTSDFQLVCTISDTGPGISYKDQQVIFDPFVQLEGGFSRRHDGMGIGLSICRRLTEMLDGSLTLQSTPGEGSRFILRLPVEKGEPRHAAAAEQQSSSQLPVLVVEDNQVNQRVIVKMLEKLGLESEIANNGQEALDLLNNKKFMLALMDLQMPVMDGFTCTRKIRHAESGYQHIPIIAVTANVMDQDRERCFNLGMDDFLEKPLKLNVLHQALSRYIQFNH